MDDGQLLTGQLYDRDTGVVSPFTEKMVNHSYGGVAVGIGVAKTEVTPHDANAALVRTFDQTALNAAYAGIHYKVANKLALDLPTELTSIICQFNTSQGEGSDTQTGDTDAIGTNISASLSLPAKSTSSVSIIPEVTFYTKPWREWAKATPVDEYYFYLPGNVTYAQVKTAVAALAGVTVLDWPAFRPLPIMCTASGKQVSLSASASIHQSVTVGSDVALTYTTGTGSSYEVGNSVRTYQLEPTIHGEITITDYTTTVNIAAAADVSWPIETNWPARSASISVPSGSVTSYVNPHVFASTPPATTVPVTGVYLYDYQTKPDKDGQTRVLAVLVDMSYFA